MSELVGHPGRELPLVHHLEGAVRNDHLAAPEASHRHHNLIVRKQSGSLRTYRIRAGQPAPELQPRMESIASVYEQRCRHGEQGNSNDRVGNRMLGESDPVRDIGEHHVPAPAEHRLDRTAMRQACERERRDADHDQRAQ